MRRLHGADRRTAGVFLRAGDPESRRQDRDHGRGALAERQAAPAAAGIPRRAGRPMRLLPVWHLDLGSGAARAQSTTGPQGDCRGPRSSSLPLRDAQPRSARGRPRRRGDGGAAVIANTLPQSLVDNPLLSQWISFEEQGRVRVGSGKVEIGQGILTALTQIAAEELDVTPEQLRLVSGETDVSPAEGFTSGSYSIA